MFRTKTPNTNDKRIDYLFDIKNEIMDLLEKHDIAIIELLTIIEMLKFDLTQDKVIQSIKADIIRSKDKLQQER